MRAKAEEINIDEEFERILPPIPRKIIFDDSEDYNSLREFIISQPYNSLRKKKPLFSGIELMDYVDFRRTEAIEKATAEHKHLFFIQQSQKGKEEFCDAAAYYQKSSKSLVILPYSYIVSQAYGIIPLLRLRKGNVNMDGINRYIPNQILFSSPTEAATFVLGQEASLDEWVDRRGKGLLAYYPDLLEKLKTNDYRPKSNSSLGSPNSTEKKHVFSIKVKGVCKAFGYFDSENGHFYMLKDSFIALNTDPEFEKSASGMARNRMLASVCTRSAHYYIVNKDTKCRSASAAASYALGKNSSYIEWEDEHGKALKDYFPERFYRKKEESPKLNIFANNTVYPIKKKEVASSPRKNEIRLFYIHKEGAEGRSCNALGYYDLATKKFILKEGSIWASEVTQSFQYTATDFLRKKHIKKYCKVSSGVIRQTHDILCDSPSIAASFVIGNSANGWEEWKDKEGNVLNDIYKAAD